jgi:hypothetical protein
MAEANEELLAEVADVLRILSEIDIIHDPMAADLIETAIGGLKRIEKLRLKAIKDAA